MNSILTALDCCFKIIHALNLQYPYESLPVWMFIQKGFYKMETLWDTEYVCVNSLLSDLSIIESSQHNNCAEINCNRSFHLINSFKKHLATHIINEPPILLKPPNTDSVNKSSLSPDSSNNPCTSNNMDIPTPLTSSIIDTELNDCLLEENYASKLLASLYSNPQIPRNVVQTVVNDMTSIFDNIHHTLQRRVSKLLSNVPVNCTQQFIPMRHVLQNFFKLKNVLTDTLEYMNKCRLYNSVLMNFTQGSVWQEKLKSYQSQIVLPIFLFFDDYEIGNPLESHSGIHKLGAVYMSIPCLPPHRQSSLSNIFLALLFHSSDRQKFGNNVIFRPLINELNFLRTTGIDFDLVNFKGNIKFDLGLIIGDNLGIHSITGFVESFSSNYPCRMCRSNKFEIKKQCYADTSLLRNLEQYHLDVVENNISNSGIKEACVGVDIMHDLLEGVCKYDMSFLLLYYTQHLQLFSLQTFNERLVCFNYGPDKRNKPSVLHIEHIQKNTIRLSASEMMSLTRSFSLIIGDFIPKNDCVWELYILLRQILDLLTSSILQIECSELLQTLVAEHHDLYMKYSKFDLKPKYHYMVHYHTMIKKFGPLISMWSMRFEAKHRISKISANTSSNRRNICKTLAIKHQLQLNDIFIRATLSNEI
ncbi:SAM domain-containing protein, partial [Aphis craccivora]